MKISKETLKPAAICTEQQQHDYFACPKGKANAGKELPRVDRVRNPVGDDKIKTLVTWWY